MYGVIRTKAFAKSLRKFHESGRFKPAARADLEFVIHTLRNGEALPREYLDHALKGGWLGYRECHIKGDLLLIYEIHEEVLMLVIIDIGSHSQLFG